MKINYLTKEHIQFLTNTMVLDCQKAKSELGWAPTKDNLTILTETIDWYKEEKL
jgi:nucleoside-diphosphate-sugar epimerase